jgi:tRNA pseudouridine55 synthase
MTAKLVGLLNVNKPKGMTSHDVVNVIRRISGVRRVGHAGTLDPAATGVLPIAVGQATRVVSYLVDKDKTYEARIRLGIATDTYDDEGKITYEAESPLNVSRSQIERELAAFVGEISQVPPTFSAIKHRGQALYRWARRGLAVEPEPRVVKIHSIELQTWESPWVAVKVECGRGTYIRSLAHELGQRLGCGAHLGGLTRTVCGPFRLEEAVPLSALEEGFAGDRWASVLHPMDRALEDLPSVSLNEETVQKVRFGQKVELSVASTQMILRAYDEEGDLVALLHHDGANGLWKPKPVFVH